MSRLPPARTIALWLMLALPFLLLHATSVAEIAIGTIDAAFLIDAAVMGDFAFLRTRWVAVAAAWWGWLVVCSLPGIGAGGWPSALQAALSVRYLVFVAALQFWVLADAKSRVWLGRAVAVAWVYYAAHIVAQFLTGRNLFGVRANLDGVLTDPIGRARVAAPLARMLPVVLLPPVVWLLARTPLPASPPNGGRCSESPLPFGEEVGGGSRPGILPWAGALALTVAALAVLLAVGQRMPLALAVFALVVACLFLPRLRPVAIVSVLAACVLIAASAVGAPVVFERLVTQFANQLQNFRTGDYGLIYDRAASMIAAHPWHGRGFDGFRSGCANPSYFSDVARAALPPLGGGVAGCNIHPHNHYLQAATDAGIPGLLLFSALVVTWLAALGRGLWTGKNPLRVGLFAAALIDQWPIASTSSLFAVEIEGFFYLLLGWGLAEAAAATDASRG